MRHNAFSIWFHSHKTVQSRIRFPFKPWNMSPFKISQLKKTKTFKLGAEMTRAIAKYRQTDH